MIFNDVENINITINEAYESIKIDKNNAEKYFDIVKDSVLRLDWGENYSENMKKYKLENFLQFAAIKNKDLLKLANAKVLQVRKKSGNKYMVKIRKKCEHQSIRERYGFIVVDTIPSIYDSPKQAKRSHSLELMEKNLNVQYHLLIHFISRSNIAVLKRTTFILLIIIG